MNKLNVKQSVPFFVVTKMKKSLHFYIERLGFIIKNKWEPRGEIEWYWLQLDDASIMLQEYRQSPPTAKLGEGVSVYNKKIGLSVSAPFYDLDKENFYNKKNEQQIDGSRLTKYMRHCGVQCKFVV